jgi:hypothetical protein
LGLQTGDRRIDEKKRVRLEMKSEETWGDWGGEKRYLDHLAAHVARADLEVDSDGGVVLVSERVVRIAQQKGRFAHPT